MSAYLQPGVRGDGVFGDAAADAAKYFVDPHYTATSNPSPAIAAGWSAGIKARALAKAKHAPVTVQDLAASVASAAAYNATKQNLITSRPAPGFTLAAAKLGLVAGNAAATAMLVRGGYAGLGDVTSPFYVAPHYTATSTPFPAVVASVSAGNLARALAKKKGAPATVQDLAHAVASAAAFNTTKQKLIISGTDPNAARLGLAAGNAAAMAMLVRGGYAGLGISEQPSNGLFGSASPARRASAELGAVDVPADNLTSLTPAAMQLWQLAMSAPACKVASPSVDTVLTLSVDPSCPLLAAALATVQQPTNVTLVQQSALLNWPHNPTAPVQVVVTANPQVVAQLAGPTGGYAIVYPSDLTNPVVVSARTIAQASAVAAAAAAKAAATAMTNPIPAALILAGVGAAVFWMLRPKKH